MAEDNFQTAKTLLAEALALDVSQLPDDATIANVTTWDSLAHLRLIMAIERYNNQLLDAETMVALSGLADIAAALK